MIPTRFTAIVRSGFSGATIATELLVSKAQSPISNISGPASGALGLSAHGSQCAPATLLQHGLDPSALFRQQWIAQAGRAAGDFPMLPIEDFARGRIEFAPHAFAVLVKDPFPPALLHLGFDWHKIPFLGAI